MNTGGSPILEADGLTFGYPRHPVLGDVSFCVNRGEFVTLVGPSGCGKTTLLLLLAGLLQPVDGRVWAHGQRVAGPAPDRALVFQDFALFPWKTVLANTALGLKYAEGRMPRRERHEVARHYIRLVGLEGFERAFPGQLSGGMQQRVGVARALAVGASILLMDEPFQAIDAQNAELMRDELLDLVAREGRTVVLVTHDLDEALVVSDRILLLGGIPSTVVDEVRVELPRPRSLTTLQGDQRDRYVGYRARMWEHLRTHVEAYRTRRQGGT